MLQNSAELFQATLWIYDTMPDDNGISKEVLSTSKINT